MRATITLMLLLLAATPATARDALGTFNDWAAFRDQGDNPRCYAVSEPTQWTASQKVRARGEPYVTVAYWPKRKVGDQVHVHSGFPIAPGSRVAVAIGKRQFTLHPSGENAWTLTPGEDLQLSQAMRRGAEMKVVTRSARGTKITDYYSLAGISAAMDAALLACAQLGR